MKFFRVDFDCGIKAWFLTIGNHPKTQAIAYVGFRAGRFLGMRVVNLRQPAELMIRFIQDYNHDWRV